MSHVPLGIDRPRFHLRVQILRRFLDQKPTTLGTKHHDHRALPTRVDGYDEINLESPFGAILKRSAEEVVHTATSSRCSTCPL